MVGVNIARVLGAGCRPYKADCATVVGFDSKSSVTDDPTLEINKNNKTPKEFKLEELFKSIIN